MCSYPSRHPLGRLDHANPLAQRCVALQLGPPPALVNAIHQDEPFTLELTAAVDDEIARLAGGCTVDVRRGD
jgi:hypothetical protein